jgi:hypothetical protein
VISFTATQTHTAVKEITWRMRIFGTMRKELKCEQRKLHTEKLHIFVPSQNIIKQ